MKASKNKMARINIGNIDAVKTLHICDCGKTINTNQKGKTPSLTKKIISIVKNV